MDLISKILLWHYCRTRYKLLKNNFNLIEKRISHGGFELSSFQKASPSPNLPNLIMIHGVMDFAFGFRRLLPHLLDICNPVVIDLPGFGRSNILKYSYLYSIPFIAKVLESSLSQNYKEGYYLLGHSMGGLISQHIKYNDYNDNIKGMILLSSGGEKHENQEELRKILLPNNTKEVERLLDYLYFKRDEPIHPLVAKVLIYYAKDYRYKLLAEDTLLNEDMIFFNKNIYKDKIYTKSLILSGKEDQITDPEIIKKMKYRFPNSKLEFLPNLKHAIHIEGAELVGIKIRKWMQARN
jgi:pimeloyl-ACP methyl ester carboxylesterase